MKTFIALLVVFGLFFSAVRADSLQEYNISYHTDYSLTPNQLVRFDTTVSIRNSFPELQVTTLSLTFPSFLTLSDLIAVDDSGAVRVDKTKSKQGTKAIFTLNKPKFGTGATEKLRLIFTEQNLTTEDNNNFYLHLPAVLSDKESSVSAIFDLSSVADTFKIATPEADQRDEKQLRWQNLTSDTIELTFVKKGIKKVQVMPQNPDNKIRSLIIFGFALLLIVIIIIFVKKRSS